jgi:ubiquitin carboxyl-terminal hydrolase 1
MGHYVAYRRKPRPPQAGAHRFDPPTLSCPLDCECEKCRVLGPIRDDETAAEYEKMPTKMPAYAAPRWLRISDETVEEVGIERVLEEYAGTFMLYYEKVVQTYSEARPSGAANVWLASAATMESSTPPTTVWSMESTRSSEETIKPAKVMRVPEQNNEPDPEREPSCSRGQSPHALEARIVRSVYAGRSRTPTPSLRGRDLSPSSTISYVSVDEAPTPQSTNGEAAMSQSQPSLKIRRSKSPARPRAHSHAHPVSIPVRAVGLRA